MTSCKKCKRPLKHPKSVERGYGPQCWQFKLSGMGILQQGTNIVLVANDPKCPEDVFFRKLLDGNIETNVRQQRAMHSPTGYGWGYAGSGPADLAYNILLRFVGPDDAIKMHQEFKNAFIANAPDQGARVKACVIRRWIEARESNGE